MPPLLPLPVLNRVKTIFDGIRISFNLPLIVIETFVIENEAKKVTLNTDDKKSNLTGDIPAAILKGCVDSYISMLAEIFNSSLQRDCFPNSCARKEI